MITAHIYVCVPKKGNGGEVSELMREKIFKFLAENLNERELELLHKDLEKNEGKTTLSLVDKRKRQLERAKQKVCVTCSKEIDPQSNKYTLYFGPDDFQKRASFCAIDCLKFFIESLDNIDYDEKRSVKVEKVSEF